MKLPIIIAGPCVIESQDCLNKVAEELVRLNKKYNIDIYCCPIKIGID